MDLRPKILYNYKELSNRFLFRMFFKYLRNGGLTIIIFVLLSQKTFGAKEIQNLRWIPLNRSELNMWYDDFDRCILQNDNNVSTVHPMEYKDKFCRDKMHTQGGNRGFECHIGMGAPMFRVPLPCKGPMSSRTYFQQGIEGFTDFSSRYVDTIITFLNVNNQTLYIVGDSLFLQAMQAFKCQYVKEHDISPWGKIPKLKYHVQFVRCIFNECLELDKYLDIDRSNNRTVTILRNFGMHYNEKVIFFL